MRLAGGLPLWLATTSRRFDKLGKRWHIPWNFAEDEDCGQSLSFSGESISEKSESRHGNLLGKAALERNVCQPRQVWYRLGEVAAKAGKYCEKCR